MIIKKIGLVTRASDPIKLGKAVREGIVTDLQEDKISGLKYFESTNSFYTTSRTRPYFIEYRTNDVT